MDESCDRILKVKKTCNISPGVVDLSVVEDENYIKGGILSSKCYNYSWYLSKIHLIRSLIFQIVYDRLRIIVHFQSTYKK